MESAVIDFDSHDHSVEFVIKSGEIVNNKIFAATCGKIYMNVKIRDESFADG